MDYYTILGIQKSANASDIKSAYRRLAKQHHPDSGGDPESFKRISEAYTTLIDDNKRAEYDYTPNEHEFKFTSRDVNDIFADIFGATTGFHHSQYSNPTNKNIKAKLEVDLDSIFTEQTRVIHIKRGRSEKTVVVNVPAGVNNGATIRYTGYGQDVLTNAPPGDLLIVITVKDILGFSRSGTDIHSKIYIDAIDAILGVEQMFSNVDGSTMNIKVPAGTQHGQMLRIKNRGLPGNHKTGNLMLEVNVVIPKKLTKEKQDLLLQYKKLDI